MAVYSLLFGHAEWPDPTPPRRGTVAREVEARRASDRRLSVTVPEALKRRVEVSAELEGVPSEAWIVRALARSVDPRALEVS